MPSCTAGHSFMPKDMATALNTCPVRGGESTKASLNAVQNAGALCRSLLERVLRMRLVYQRVNMARAISFEYLNRQLVWHELSEVLLFLLPLINVGRLKRFVTHQLPQLKAAFLPVAGEPLLSVPFSCQLPKLMGSPLPDVSELFIACMHAWADTAGT